MRFFYEFLRGRQAPVWLALGLGGLLSVLPLLCSSSLVWWAVTHEAALHTWHWPQWLAIFGLLVPLMAFALVPTTLASAMTGYFLGFAALWGIVPAYLLASLLGYAAARKAAGYGLDTVLVQWEKWPRLLELIRQDAFRLVVYLKISPVLPFALSNAALALGRAGIWPLLGGGLAGMLPRTLLAVWAGSQAQALQQVQQPNLPLQILSAVLLIAALIGLGQMGRRWKNYF